MDLSNIFNGIEEQAKKAIKPEEGDYFLYRHSRKKDDGEIELFDDNDMTGTPILYCCRCNTPKQCMVEIFGKIRTPMCLCKCEVEKRDREEAERKRIERMIEIQKLRRMGFPESEMDKWTFAADDLAHPKISSVMMNYASNFDKMFKSGKGLLLYGTIGSGKSFYAASIVNHLIDEGIPCLMTNFSRLVNTIQGMYDGKQDYIDGLNRFDLLVIDDLSAERDTEYMNEIVFSIIDSRYRAGLPLIVTTNMTAEEIKNPADIRKQRIYSRLLEMTIPIEVSGYDRRRQKLKDDYSEFSDILGLNVTD